MKSIVRLIISVFCLTTTLFSASCPDIQYSGNDGLKFSFGTGGEG